MEPTKEALEQLSKEQLIDMIIGKQKPQPQPKKPQKPFDFSKHRKVKIALKFSYLGKNYKGLVVQKHTEDTVEHHIFQALKKTCLVEDIAKSQYTRCGRTDKGVNAMGNVCSLWVREASNYCQMLNHCLPPDIRMLAYAEVPPHFDARFSCIYREYKYFFCQG